MTDHTITITRVNLVRAHACEAPSVSYGHPHSSAQVNTRPPVLCEEPEMTSCERLERRPEHQTSLYCQGPEPKPTSCERLEKLAALPPACERVESASDDILRREVKNHWAFPHRGNMQ